MTRNIFILLTLASVTHVHAAFFGLDFRGFAREISPDGTYVGGTFSPSSSNGNTTAYRWSVEGGLENMGLFPGSSLAAHASYTRAISLNGSTVVGYGRTDSSSGHRAFAWTASTGYQILPTPEGFSSAEATAISHDGGSIFGRSIQSTRSEATRWTESGVVTLGTLPGTTSSSITDTSADGSVAVGRSGSTAFYWRENAGISAIPAWNATAVSAEGNFVVGTTTGYPGTEAYRWSVATGLQPLGFLDPTHTNSHGTSVSANGNVVVGYSDMVAFIWTEATGMLDLSSVIAMNGGDPSEWSLYTNGVLKISDDGSTIIGNGAGPNGHNEVWLAHINTIRVPDTLDLALEWSEDLRNWESIPITSDLLTPDGQVRVPAGEDAGFYRLRIDGARGR